MKKYTLLKYIFILFTLSFIPGIASASSVYFETSRTNVSVGDTFIITAKIDTKDIYINSVEGEIFLDSTSDNLVVNDFSLAKSVFSLWPVTPSLSKDGKVISFVGGVPGGFKLDKAILFNIIVEANREGDVVITPKNIAIFANDGKGSRVPVDFKNLNIKVSPKSEADASLNEWSSLVSSDKISPEKFDIIIGRDNSIFDGKKFAFFNAVDNQSGISYYEVSENGKPVVRSGSTYVLENQNEKIDPNITVIAYDKAGNKTVSIYKKPSTSIYGFSLNFILILISIIILWIIIRKIKKNAQNK